MISLDEMIDVIKSSKEVYDKLHTVWETKVREIYHRYNCTEIEEILYNTSTRSIFKKLIKEICDIEYELMHDMLDESCGGSFSTLLGFDCECSDCQCGPVNEEHYKEMIKETDEVIYVSDG